MQKTNQQIDAEKQAFKEKILSYGLLYKCITGSRLYGTFRPDSDTDIRGVFIAPPEYYYGFLNKVETNKVSSSLSFNNGISLNCPSNDSKVLMTEL